MIRVNLLMTSVEDALVVVDALDVEDALVAVDDGEEDGHMTTR